MSFSYTESVSEGVLRFYLISHHFSSNTISSAKNYNPIETKTSRVFSKTVKQEKKKKKKESNFCKNQKERSELKFLSII
ncbi:unnamed protein product [Arabidopsis lyrata]|uniref:Expressed protein n=1 Tax=Arabidopsis lyrata subsp. lyrata TaxID=81972 RepID=D7KCI0_ARALL|nr:expressed protein [Arabidopsis lyrata subsp. lyrata]CAH8251059.1 unnamed protein product [Arabidopsis lyrata]